MGLANITDNILVDSGILVSSLQGSLTLTTTGTSGAATLIGDTLNIPQYSGGGGGGMAIGGTITSATEGSVLFAGASGVLAQDNANFFWDDTNNRLGLGTTSPQVLLQLGEGSLSNSTINQFLRVNSGTYNALSYAHLDLFNFGNNFGNALGWRVTSGTESVGVSVGRYLSFNTVVTDGSGNPSTSTERMRITSDGNVGIATTTIGSRLQVNGNAAIGYSASTAAPTNGLAVAGNVGVGVIVSNSNWTTRSVLQLGGFGTSLSGYNGGGGATELMHNAVVTTGFSYNYLLSVGATRQYMDGDNFIFYNAPTGTAGAAITFTERMRIGTNVGIGTSTIGSKLQVNGNAAIGYSASTAAPTNGLAVSGKVGIGSTSVTNGTTYGGANQSNLLKLSSSGYPALEINSTNDGGGSIQFTNGTNLPNQVRGLVGYNSAGAAALDFNINNIANGAIKISTNNTDRLIITSGGDVGIGNTTLGTATKLTIGGSETASSAIARGQLLNTTLVAAANYDTLVGLDISPTFTNGSFIGVNNYALRLNAASGSFVWNLYASGTANNYMEGNLGIGVAVPNYKLDVNGSFSTVTSSIYLQYNSGILYHYGGSGDYYQYINGANYLLSNRTSTGALVFSTQDTERMRITSGGNVGIGVTNPSEKLHLRDTTNGYTGLRLEGNGNYAGSDWTIYASSLSAPSANDFLGFYNNSTTDGATAEYKFRLFKTGAALFNSTIQTGAPTGGTAQPWKLGTVYTGTCVPSDFGSFGSWFTGTVIEIEVNGTTYKVPAIIDNYC